MSSVNCIKSLYAKTAKQDKPQEAKIEPIEYIDKYKLQDKFKYYQEIGEKAIKNRIKEIVTLFKTKM